MQNLPRKNRAHSSESYPDDFPVYEKSKENSGVKNRKRKMKTEELYGIL